MEKPDLICLSGLITPSLAEMVNVAKALESASLRIPLIVGGATTSKIHTALKISPVYGAPVVHASDAAQNPIVASKLLNPALHDEFVSELDSEYGRLRDSHVARQHPLLPLDVSRERRLRLDWNVYVAPVPGIPVGRPKIVDVDIREVARFINWKMFFHSWRLTGSFLDGFPYEIGRAHV